MKNAIGAVVLPEIFIDTNFEIIVNNKSSSHFYCTKISDIPSSYCVHFHLFCFMRIRVTQLLTPSQLLVIVGALEDKQLAKIHTN